MEETLGKRIVRCRKGLGLTQDALAEKLGVTAQAVSKWENDQSCPDITTLPRLATIFGTTTDALLGLEAPSEQAMKPVTDAPGLNIDNKDGHWDLHWNGGRKSDIGVGLWVVSTGLMMLAAICLELKTDLWTAVWTTGLTIFGLFGLWPQFSCFRLGCALFGGYFIVNELAPDLFSLEKAYILPIVLVLFGLSLLLDAGHKKKIPTFSITSSEGKSRQHYQVTGERFDCSVAFCEYQQNVEMDLFRQGCANVRFGELTLDLSGCQEFAKNCTLALNCSFGELTVLLPASIRAQTSTRTTLAEFAVLGHPAPDTTDVIQISVDASFGEVTLRYI